MYSWWFSWRHARVSLVTTQRSRKRAADREYAKARAQRYVAARGRCERCVINEAVQTHHVVRRAHKPGEDVHNIENLRALCERCHAHVHANVAESKADGWIATDWPQL